MTVSKYDLLFDKWKASLAGRDRSKPFWQSNFEELFDELKTEGLVLESAYEYLDRAIKAYTPSKTIVKNTYNKWKSSRNVDLQEFQDNWFNGIADTAKVAFFNVFPITTKKIEDDNEPKMFGNMSAKEYKMQRAFADEFPVLNTRALEKKLKEPLDLSLNLDDLYGSNADQLQSADYQAGQKLGKTSGEDN